MSKLATIVRHIAAADAVCAAARRGVAWRVMVDALGSPAFIRSPHWRQLQDAGVRVLATLDDIPRLGHLAVGRLDLRNHRKVAVIDNRIAFCGSQNCADPEFRVAARFAPWVDILLRCEGPVVRQAQHLFLSTWIAETGEQIESLVVDDAATSATIRERQLGYVSVSQRVALDTARRWPFGRRLVQNAVGMMAPVL